MCSRRCYVIIIWTRLHEYKFVFILHVLFGNFSKLLKCIKLIFDKNTLLELAVSQINIRYLYINYKSELFLIKSILQNIIIKLFLL